MRRALERLRRSGRGRWLGAAALAALALAFAARGGDSGSAALGVLAALGALAAGAAALSRRAGAGAGPGLLEVEARSLLGRDNGVALVRAAGRRFLVGFGPGGTSALAELDREETAP